MNSSVPEILSRLVDCLSDAVASLDALEAQLEKTGVLPTGALSSRFHTHKQTVESHLLPLRLEIDALQD
jgi:hypothetical protein